MSKMRRKRRDTWITILTTCMRHDTHVLQTAWCSRLAYSILPSALNRNNVVSFPAKPMSWGMSLLLLLPFFFFLCCEVWLVRSPTSVTMRLLGSIDNTWTIIITIQTHTFETSKLQCIDSTTHVPSTAHSSMNSAYTILCEADMHNTCAPHSLLSQFQPCSSH